ncbi:probable tubulin polyglutamylase TTLL9 [Cyclospora cayetanensis]|uniref:Tubulin--tyrosine ligase-like protein 9 n=1 Tax=Cyclospora cayetanensis TaxID=88456 RepID=A0A6P6S1N1_9EIME|nr:probable tubulin polyglutamylase TTLL9 [Cyclospora cayetanensis]
MRGTEPTAGVVCCPRPPIRFRCSFRNTMLDVLRARGWKETDSETEWDFFWCDKDWISETFDKFRFQPNQRINHFRNHHQLTRKDLLIRNLRRHKRQLERECKAQEAESFNICPQTFLLPLEYSIFVEEFKRNAVQKCGSVWIMKPVGRSQGKGIFLIERLSQLADWRGDARSYRPVDTKSSSFQSLKNPEEAEQSAEAYVCQRYIQDPLVIGGKKFDLRLFCFVKAFAPLTAYLYRGGFARFSSVHFSMHEDQRDNLSVHLTNVAIQKNLETYDEEAGGKWPLRSLKLFLMTKFGQDRVEHLMRNIQEMILKSLLAVQKTILHDKHCCELYGYDVIVDSSLKPWLLEVNASPSLTATTEEDYRFKFAMLDDLLSIVDMENVRTGEERSIGGFDLVYKGTLLRRASLLPGGFCRLGAYGEVPVNCERS